MSLFRHEDFEVPVQLTLASPPGSRGARLFSVMRVTDWVRGTAVGRVRPLVKLRVPCTRGPWGRTARGSWGDLVMMRRLNLKALAEAAG